ALPLVAEQRLDSFFEVVAGAPERQLRVDVDVRPPEVFVRHASLPTPLQRRTAEFSDRRAVPTGGCCRPGARRFTATAGSAPRAAAEPRASRPVRAATLARSRAGGGGRHRAARGVRRRAPRWGAAASGRAGALGRARPGACTCGKSDPPSGTTQLSSGAGCKRFIPRKAVMPAPSSAAVGSAAVPPATALRSDQPHAGPRRIFEVAEAPGPGHPHGL